MTFRFANVEGRSALVDSEDCWYDASRISGGVLSTDPMLAWAQLDDVNQTARVLSAEDPDGKID
ncbi:MAG: hypothetical protein QOJ03_1149, partial [Frankiaceae bacterium]|nr:hypothetical protein [Frankiaceae bacterium]